VCHPKEELKTRRPRQGEGRSYVIGDSSEDVGMERGKKIIADCAGRVGNCTFREPKERDACHDGQNSTKKKKNKKRRSTSNNGQSTGRQPRRVHFDNLEGRKH